MFLWELYVFLNVFCFISLFSLIGAKSENETAKNFKFLVRSGYIPKTPSLEKYAVSIRTGSSKKFWGSNHFCGGAIYNSHTIITAAHCVVMRQGKMRASSIMVVAGTPDRLEKTSNTQEMRVKKIIPHHRYSPSKMGFDIAVLILQEDLILDGVHTQAIQLTNDPPSEGRKCTVVGWGTLYFGGFMPAHIVYGDLQLWSNYRCTSLARIVTKDMVCAKNPSNYELDSCQGDSGGPLICNEKLTGVVSWGFACGIRRIPGFYANIYYFRDWIEKNRAVKIFSQNVMVFLVFYLTCLNLNPFVYP